jgi:hypothetical protein
MIKGLPDLNDMWLDPMLDLSCEKPFGGDAAALARALRGSDVTVEMGDRQEKDLFMVGAQPLTINGERIHVFEYVSDEALEMDSASISRGGMVIGEKRINWFATPHFYKGCHILVLYTGNNELILNLLISVLGKQIAGG